MYKRIKLGSPRYTRTTGQFFRLCALLITEVEFGKVYLLPFITSLNRKSKKIAKSY